MLIPVLISVFLCLLGYILVMVRSSKPKQIFFVGPHSTGKTKAILSLLNKENSTVTTIASHKISFNDKEIFEIVPKDDQDDFITQFSLNKEDNFVFFVKNEEEIDDYPDLSDFNVKFVLWNKVNKNSIKKVIYLNESRENLVKLIKSY